MFVFRVLRLGATALLGFSALISAAQAETLTSALAYAYENNPDIASSFLSVRAARQGIRAAEGAHLPTIGAEGTLGASWNSATNAWTSSDSIGIGYNQNLFDNNASSAAIKGAQAQYDAAIYGAQNAEQNVLLAVVQAYVQVVTTRRIVEIRNESIGFVEAQVQAARDRLDLGEGTRLDVAQAGASLAQSQASYQAAVNNLRVAEANYQRYVGRAPSSLEGGYNYQHLMPPSLEAAIAQATTSHPALLATASQLQAAQYGYEETIASFGPSLSFSGNVGAGGFTGNTVTTQASVSLRLSVPIYTPQRDPAIEQANISQIQSQLQGLATRDQIVEAVRQGWSGIQATTAQIEAATAAVAASRIALQAVMDQNEVGQATTNDVLDARASVATVEEALITAQSQRTLAAYSLIAAIGQLSAADLRLPVQARTVEGEVIVSVPAPTTDAWGNLR
ncbi:TolC family outer membrane protein [Pelagibacterium lacus]|uniref:Type I secretion protein TolC n=1 Tax=Pelagibacterium lacus TaxID=2282655 RepID=A0A369W5Z1_9HYPH|nr:TolC family outer membrane protein [Pelagibacterium lacus]RDE09285.1 hypothetical protein DVH29_07460 [Pelagibacterium lacus]